MTGMIENPRDCWRTPDYVFNYWNVIKDFRFTLDAAADASNTKCAVFNSITDGSYSLFNNVVWCNPPYSNIAPWVDDFLRYCHTGVMLLPARIDQRWFHEALEDGGTAVWFVRGRIQFVPPPGVQKSSNREGSLFLVRRDGEAGVHSTSIDEMRNA